MKLRRLATTGAIALAIVLAVLVVGSLVLVATIDVDDYRGLLAQEVERRTGRAMRVDGGLALAMSLTPTFSAEGVSLANAPWASQAHMVRVDRVEARVALAPLLAGRVEIRRLLMVRPHVELETAADGRASWRLERPAGPRGAPHRAGPTLGLDVRSLDLRDLRVTHREASGVLRVLRVPSLSISDAGERLAVLLEGRYQDDPLTLSGTVDRLPTLLSNAPYGVELGLTMTGVEASVDGEVLGPVETATFTGRATLRIDDLAERTGLAERGVGPGLAFAASADAVDASAAGLRVGALALTLGDSSGSGTLGLVPGAARPAFQAALTFERLDLDRLLATAPADAGATGQATAEANVPANVQANVQAPANRGGARVFSEAVLDASALRALDARVQIDAKTARIAGADVADVELTAVLAGGVLVLDPIGAGVGGSRARGRARIDAAGEDVGVAIAFDAAGVDLDAVLGARAARYVEGRASLAVDVNGRGPSVAAIMGALTGEARALVGEGRVRARGAEMMIGGVTALMSTMTTDDSAWSTLRCAAADFALDSGVATANLLLVDTEHATVRGEGSADLGAERLAMKFTPSPKSVTLNLAVPVKVSGTFTDPVFRPDELATARRVGSVALLAFPPTAIASLGALAVYGVGAAGAGLADRDGSANPCLALASGGPAPAVAPGQPSKASKAAATVKKQIGRAADRIKGLFGR